MKNNDKLTVEGIILECLKGTQFAVEIKINSELSKIIVGYISGKMRKSYTRVAPGDKVLIELSKYDLDKGRIVEKL